MEKKKIIEFRNIVKNFDGQIVLKGINLDCDPVGTKWMR